MMASSVSLRGVCHEGFVGGQLEAQGRSDATRLDPDRAVTLRSIYFLHRTGTFWFAEGAPSASARDAAIRTRMLGAYAHGPRDVHPERSASLHFTYQCPSRSASSDLATPVARSAAAIPVTCATARLTP